MPWLESAPGTIIPAGGDPGRPGDICPQGWENDFDRAQMSTQVLIGRQAPSTIPVLNYNFPGATPPTTGQVTLNAAQSAATVMQVHKTTADGADATIWLRYLKAQDTVRFADADNTATAVGYRITATPTEQPDRFDIPIVWQDGQTPVPTGIASLTLQLLAEPPELYIDTFGKTTYGIETLTRTDLLNTSKALFPTLADRILEIRGSNSVPRIEAVTLAARTGHSGQNIELMSTCRPEKPSRYRMRLAVNERPVFDRMCFASSIRHFIARDEWTLRIGLDAAEWAGQL